MPRPRENGVRLSYYELGATSLFACRADQRFSYCLYIPGSYEEEGARAYPLAVLIHGTERAAQGFRDRYIGFAERHQCAVLAPLFPCGIEEPGELDNYKYLEYRGIRFDRLLLAMVDEVAERYRLDSGRLLMHGFSGGGHFVHRFLYLHPERLKAASIGAPGFVTLPDDSKPWWVGTGGMEAALGKALRIAALRDVRVQMIVGAEDTETWEITAREGTPRWMPGVNDAGRTRIERLRTLERAFLNLGVPVRFDLVPGVGHEEFAPGLVARVGEFLGGALDYGISKQHNSIEVTPVSL
jgi:pimeloyl-ACP methyl ester carboxylesterase